MKRIITFFLSCLMAVAAFATDYKGDLVITVQTYVTTDSARIVTVERTDASNSLYRLSIKDFVYHEISLGDIVLRDIKGERQTDGSVVLATSGYPFKVTLLNMPLDVTIDFEGVISKDEVTFEIKKLNIETGVVGTVVCEFVGTNVNTSAIKDITFDSGECQIYNLAGQKVQDMNQSGIYFVRYANGTTKKVIKK